jgi:hypothetical protein
MFTPDAVTKFFYLFEPEMELIKHAPNRLYNCDETGITIDNYGITMPEGESEDPLQHLFQVEPHTLH